MRARRLESAGGYRLDVKRYPAAALTALDAISVRCGLCLMLMKMKMKIVSLIT